VNVGQVFLPEQRPDLFVNTNKRVFSGHKDCFGLTTGRVNHKPTQSQLFWRKRIMAEKSKRGFGSMDINKRREIASKGGKAAHAKGSAHRFTPEEAREAGRKGGQAAHQKGTAHEFTPEEASFAGRKGGKAASSREAGQEFGDQQAGMVEGLPEQTEQPSHETAMTPGT
jgi:general stress protein YciG